MMKYDENEMMCFLRANEEHMKEVLNTGFVFAGIEAEERQELNADAFCERMFCCGWQYSNDIINSIMQHGYIPHSSLDKAFISALNISVVAVGHISTYDAIKLGKVFFDAGIRFSHERYCIKKQKMDKCFASYFSKNGEAELR